MPSVLETYTGLVDWKAKKKAQIMSYLASTTQGDTEEVKQQWAYLKQQEESAAVLRKSLQDAQRTMITTAGDVTRAAVSATGSMEAQTIAATGNVAAAKERSKADIVTARYRAMQESASKLDRQAAAALSSSESDAKALRDGANTVLSPTDVSNSIDAQIQQVLLPQLANLTPYQRAVKTADFARNLRVGYQSSAGAAVRDMDPGKLTAMIEDGIETRTGLSPDQYSPIGLANAKEEGIRTDAAAMEASAEGGAPAGGRSSFGVGGTARDVMDKAMSRAAAIGLDDPNKVQEAEARAAYAKLLTEDPKAKEKYPDAVAFAKDPANANLLSEMSSAPWYVVSTYLTPTMVDQLARLHEIEADINQRKTALDAMAKSKLTYPDLNQQATEIFLSQYGSPKQKEAMRRVTAARQYGQVELPPIPEGSQGPTGPEDATQVEADVSTGPMAPVSPELKEAQRNALGSSALESAEKDQQARNEEAIRQQQPAAPTPASPEPTPQVEVTPVEPEPTVEFNTPTDAEITFEEASPSDEAEAAATEILATLKDTPAEYQDMTPESKADLDSKVKIVQDEVSRLSAALPIMPIEEQGVAGDRLNKLVTALQAIVARNPVAFQDHVGKMDDETRTLIRTSQPATPTEAAATKQVSLADRANVIATQLVSSSKIPTGVGEWKTTLADAIGHKQMLPNLDIITIVDLARRKNQPQDPEKAVLAAMQASIASKPGAREQGMMLYLIARQIVLAGKNIGG